MIDGNTKLAGMPDDGAPNGTKTLIETTTPTQIKQAMANHRMPPRTHGAKIRDALLHVKQSRKDKPRIMAGLESFGGDYQNSILARGDCYGRR